MNFVNLFVWNSHYPIFSRLCDFLAIGDIVALTRTCRQFANLYQLLLPVQWNVDRRLRRFVRNPAGLRSQMGQSDALISGSFAVQFFERATWLSADLDMFVTQGLHFELLKNYIVNVEGYQFLRSKVPTEYGTFDLIEVFDAWLYSIGLATDFCNCQVLTFVRSLPEAPDTVTQIQIVVTNDIPIQPILRNFHSTAVVNVISWNKAFALFPLTTFFQHKSFMLRKLDDFYKSVVQKYTERGWKTLELMWPEDKKDNHPIRRYRRVGDRFSWVIQFDTREITWSQNPDFVLEHACFGIKNYEDYYGRVSAQRSYYFLEAPLFVSHALRYRYTYQYEWSDWVQFLGERSDRMTLLALRKTRSQQQLPGYVELLHRISSGDAGSSDNLQKPLMWTYWDSEIPGWYEAWESGVQRLRR